MIVDNQCWSCFKTREWSCSQQKDYFSHVHIMLLDSKSDLKLIGRMQAAMDNASNTQRCFCWSEGFEASLCSSENRLQKVKEMNVLGQLPWQNEGCVQKGNSWTFLGECAETWIHIGGSLNSSQYLYKSRIFIFYFGNGEKIAFKKPTKNVTFSDPEWWKLHMQPDTFLSSRTSPITKKQNASATKRKTISQSWKALINTALILQLHNAFVFLTKNSVKALSELPGLRDE